MTQIVVTSIPGSEAGKVCSSPDAADIALHTPVQIIEVYRSSIRTLAIELQ
jgi:hypothetical protein